MTTIGIIIGCLFAIYLTLADIGSTGVGKRYGRRNGLLFWIATVAVPIVVALVLDPKHAILCMVLSAILSFIAYRKRMHDLKKGSSDDYSEPCSDF